MTPDELRPILTAYRARIQPAWSKATAHPSFEGADGSPVGQCGVTSAWLQRRLREDHGIETLYCSGSYYAKPTSQGVAHCWLEYINGHFVVLDLTADQIGGDEVVCDSYMDLYSQGVHYVTHDGSPGPAPSVAFARRLTLLEGALS